MSVWQDEKYLRLLSPQLERFAQKGGQHTFNLRCPLCGDSRIKSKARGYLFPKNDCLIFKCHNCGVALPFSALLKRCDQHLYADYLKEKVKDDRPAPTPVSPPQAKPKPLAASPRVNQTFPYVEPLDACRDDGGGTGAVYRYAKTRLIPPSQFIRLAATVRARSWLLPLVGPEKAAKVTDGVPYLIQPLKLPTGAWYGAQLRTLTTKEFLTFRWGHESLKVFGLDCWTPNKTAYIVEGPLDALFVLNALSTCGSDLLSGIRVAEEQNLINVLAPRVYVWDNEPHNKEVARHLRTAIALHERVVIWPENYPKDINDMVRANLDVNVVLAKRTFQGLTADLEFKKWCKVA